MHRRLIVLRHAKSDWSQDLPDHDRPLAARGRREAALAGQWLREHAADLDLVLCSSAVRARRTWKHVARQLTDPPEPRIEDRLYAASDAELVQVIREIPERVGTVLLIGHNPGLEDVIMHLTGNWCLMKTSSIAVLSSDSDWADATLRWARLDRSVTPRP